MPSATQEPPLAAPFIVGQHRSGTTLLRLMLDAHPDLAIPPETQFIPLAAARCRAAPVPGAAFVHALTTHVHWRDHHVDERLLRERVAAIRPFDLGSALRAFYDLYRERFGKARWGDKTPRYVREMTLIQRLLPEARFVHIIRDGRDVTLSVRDERRLAGKRPGSVARAAAQWAEKITEARRQAGELRGYVEVRYEDLVLETEATLRTVCEAIELPWDPAMLGYHTTAATRLAELVTVDHKWASAAQRRVRHVRTGQPPEAGRVGRWRSEMTPTERREFEEVAGPLLDELGYETGAVVAR